jgi:subtilase family serine protease
MKLVEAIKRLTLAIALTVVVKAMTPAPLATAQEQVQTPVVDQPANRVVLAHTTHPAAKTATDLGRIAGKAAMERMVLMLAGKENQEQSLQTLLDSLHTKGSPRYHQWLTPEEFGVEFGPGPEAIQQVTTWLATQGFSIDRVARSGRWIQFSGTAAQAEAAFQTEMHRYQANGTTHIANAGDLSLPVGVAPLVTAVLPLHDFSFKRPLLGRYFAVQRNAQGNLVPVDPAFTIFNPGVSHFLAPGDYTKIYDLGSLYQNGANGSGQTIAIVARSKVELTDVETFRNIFGLPANDPTTIVDGPDPGFTGFGDSLEASLDVEWAGAVAPKAAIDLVVSASTLTTDGVDLSAAYIVDNNLAPIMTVSFGACEKVLGTAENAFFNALWQQAAAQGISVFVSTGDSGAAGCDDPNIGPAVGGLAVSGLASTPFNTAVGGTKFNENGNDSTFWNSTNGSGFVSAIGYIPEVVWNESCDPTVNTCIFNQANLFASGGGASTIYAKPSWQDTAIPGVPNDGQRDIPDISLAAALHDGYLLCFAGSCQTTTDSSGKSVLLSANVVGGTSASSPAFAGIMAIVDQQSGGRQGLANYVLYPLAAAENFANCNSSARTNPSVSSTCVFNDITDGNNSVPGQAGFNAGTGYDLATGLGSADAANFVQAFVARVKGLLGTATALAANGATSVQHGQPVSFTVSVNPTSGTAVPTGNISLVTTLQGAAGAGSVVTVGAGALNNGAFTSSFANLPGGQYSVSAHYPGDQDFQGSDSSGVAVNITKENSTTSLASASTFPYGEEFPLHTVVSGASGQGNASGTMTFSDGNTQLGVVPLNSEGQADFLPSGQLTLTVGTHSLGANYSGDNSFNPSIAQPVAITITKAVPGLFVETFSSFTGTGTVSIFVFNTGPILPTGTAQLFEAGKAIGNPVQLVSAGGQIPTANFSGLILTAGIDDFSVSYSGDSVYQSTAFDFQVPVFSPFAFDPAQNSSLSAAVSAGQTATYNLILSEENGFTGTVALNCSGAPSGTTCSVNPASADLLTQSSSVPVTVTVSTTAQASNYRAPFKTMPFAIAVVMGALAFTRKRKGQRPILLMVLAISLGTIISACGGRSNSAVTNPPARPSTSILTITGTSNGATNTIQLQLTITH